jgi:RNA polymerase sigma factor (sigma-70 family)
MDEDRLKLEECLEGSEHALPFLREKYHSFLVSMLSAKGASAAEAEDLVADLWGDCVPGAAGRTSLLAKYSGRCAVKSWLTTVAINRLIDLKRRQRLRFGTLQYTNEQPGIDLLADTSGFDPTAEEGALILLLRDSLQAAFAHCPGTVLLMLRLVYVHDLTQREVGRMWGWHESKISRALSQAMEEIKVNTLRRLRKMDTWLELTWEDFLELCETHQTGFL